MAQGVRNRCPVANPSFHPECSEFWIHNRIHHDCLFLHEDPHFCQDGPLRIPVDTPRLRALYTACFLSFFSPCMSKKSRCTRNTRQPERFDFSTKTARTASPPFLFSGNGNSISKIGERQVNALHRHRTTPLSILIRGHKDTRLLCSIIRNAVLKISTICSSSSILCSTE